MHAARNRRPSCVTSRETSPKRVRGRIAVEGLPEDQPLRNALPAAVGRGARITLAVSVGDHLRVISESPGPLWLVTECGPLRERRRRRAHERSRKTRPGECPVAGGHLGRTRQRSRLAHGALPAPRPAFAVRIPPVSVTARSTAQSSGSVCTPPGRLGQIILFWISCTGRAETGVVRVQKSDEVRPCRTSSHTAKPSLDRVPIAIRPRR